MKLAVLTLAAAFAISQSASAQSSEKPAPQSAASAQAAPDPFASVPAPKPDDVKSIDAIMTAVYDVISGPPGERDWSRFRSLFLPTARLTAATKGPDGAVRLRPMSADDYATRAGGYFLKNGFFEHPIVNRVQTFGNVAQVFSSYESRHAAGEAPFARGINSFQLLNDGKRWWVVSILWDEERPDNPLPKDFAGK
ncbi:MAG TPA: hypothetical protein VFF95_03690 [Candidatus Binatus sp.]|jgi:hypothetical protein|nr:hypothetical protein [Candidatus Binatus sp.]